MTYYDRVQKKRPRLYKALFIKFRAAHDELKITQKALLQVARYLKNFPKDDTPFVQDEYRKIWGVLEKFILAEKKPEPFCSSIRDRS